MARISSMANHIKGLCAALVCVCLLVGGGLALPDAGTEGRVIRVGRFPYDELLKVNEDGTYGGYGFAYLQEIARYTGWRYEFVDVGWGESLEMLARGELDLMGAIMHTPERDAAFDFGVYPFISGYGVLATNLDNQTLAYEEFQTFDGMAVGVLEHNVQTINFLTYSQEKGFTPRIREYPSEEEVYAALERGEVDGILQTNILRSQQLRVVATFGENKSYFATTRGNDKVLEALNDAMRQIQLKNPYFNEKLWQKYYGLQVSTAVSFTREELEFIQSAPPIPCIYVPDAPPFSSFDPATGEVAGISVDICRLLEARTGLRFTWRDATSASEAVELLRTGQALLIPGKYHDLGWSWANGITQTEPYLQGQMVMVTADRAAVPEVVALYDQDAQGGLAAEVIGGPVEFRQYDSILHCVDAVLRGEADAAFVNSTIASYMANNPEYGRLQTTPIYGYAADVAMAVSGQADPRLLGVLDKGLRAISVTEINDLVLQHMRMGRSGELATLLYLHPVETVVLISMTFLTLILALMVLLHFRLKNARALRRSLYTDELTGYPNYRAMVQEAPALRRESGDQYALVYLDIHQFKVINDTFGYEVGDRVLEAASHVLHSFVGPRERFGRLYADTFALLLRCGEEGLLEARLGDLSRRLTHLPMGEAEAVSPLFLGGVYLLPQDFGDLDQACDRANYAKDSIQNRFTNTFVFYDDVMRRRVLAEKELESSMQSALERMEFIPYYQPKVNALTGKVVGGEALARWVHPEKGLLPPADFLPFYEKNGFIVKIDLLIFEQVCRDISRWTGEGRQVPPISINFSRRHVWDDSLPQRLWETARRYGVPTSLLEVEITETEELENLEAAMEFVRRLRSHGFSVSIDDYGTGYSSISFLQQLPLDSLKLDRTFLLSAMESNKARDMMRYLVTAMRQNKIRVVCEGVETREQRDFALSLDCRFIQGYFYSTALPQTEFEAYLYSHGVDGDRDQDFLPIARFDQGEWSGSEDFLNRVMPAWFACCLAEPGHPVQFISPKFLEGMGYSALEFEADTGGRYLEWVHPDDRAQMSQMLGQWAEGEEEQLLQYRLRKKDGSYLWIREVARRVLTDDGHQALLGACTDISDLMNLRTEQLRLMDAIPGGVGELLLRPEGPIIQQATDRFYEVIGHSRAEMEVLGNNLTNILYQPDQGAADIQLKKMMGVDAPPSCACAFRIRDPEGKLRWISFRATGYPSPEGPRVTAITYSNDEEVRARKAAEISRAKLELTLTLTNHAVFEYDIHERRVVSHSGLTLYGIPESAHLDVVEDLVQSEFVCPEDVETFRAAHWAIASGQSHTSYEMRVRSRYDLADAPYVWVRVSLGTIFDEERRPTRAVGVVENIDQERHFEYAFRQETQFRKAFTESSLMAMEVNLTGDVIQRISGTRGFRLREISNSLPQPDCYTLLSSLAVQLLVAEEDREMYAQAFDRAHLLECYRRGQREQEFEYRRITPEGERLWNSALIHLGLDQLSGDVMAYVYHRDIHERKLAEQELVERATRDSLTGVLNRAAAEEEIQRYLDGPLDGGRLQAFVMLDINHFKTFNDTHGHPEGDRYLLMLAQIAQRQLRAEDIVARMGGDEFALLLKNLPNRASAYSVAQKLADAMEEIGAALQVEGETSVSIGIALAPYDGLEFDTLYRRADEALYQAKRKQGSHIVLYEADDTQEN